MDMTFDSTFSYHPPPGGDISLKSSDGDVFLAHSILLQLGSSVFADMFSTATQSNIIELSDDSESVSLMLRFIYPPPFLDNLPIELLETGLRVAQKYDIGGIVTSIDHILSSQSPNKNCFILSNPIHALCLAIEYELPKTRKTAAEAVRPGRFTFNCVDQIKLLAETYASAAGVVGLLGEHCIRTQCLSDLLLGQRKDILAPYTTEHKYVEGKLMICPIYSFAYEGSAAIDAAAARSRARHTL
ncbi:hypothetical protein FRC09_010427 [Ceratobasidium sp. 395]|nr:hypothetical protein FRC09_010427 [Ceratobasidium sp. 395]